MSGPLFSLRDLSLPSIGRHRSRSTDSTAQRLNTITMQIPSGSTAIVGLSGAGKTSLLNVLAGFEVEYSGQLTSHVRQKSSGRLPLYWVPQNGGLWPHLSAEKHLEIVVPLQIASDSARFLKNADEILAAFDLQHRRGALPGELSQGERSRLSLARALATRPGVLLLDEPLSHVDPIRKPGYWKIVRRMVAEENISMVFTTHEPETVLRQSEHVICLDAGTVVFEGATKTLYDAPPGPRVGEFLGPLNWFSESEAQIFLQDAPPQGNMGIRPERLQVHVDATSGIEVLSLPFVGAYCETVLRHQSGTTKTVLHQLSELMPNVGDRVTLRGWETT